MDALEVSKDAPVLELDLHCTNGYDSLDILAFELDALLCDSIIEFDTTFEWTNTFLLEPTFEWPDTSLLDTTFNWTDTPQALRSDVTDDPMSRQSASDIVSTQPFCDPKVQCGKQRQL